MKHLANVIGALILLFGGISHIVRYVMALEVNVGTYVIPISWSLPFGVLLILIGLWMFVVLKK